MALGPMLVPVRRRPVRSIHGRFVNVTVSVIDSFLRACTLPVHSIKHVAPFERAIVPPVLLLTRHSPDLIPRSELPRKGKGKGEGERDMISSSPSAREVARGRLEAGTVQRAKVDSLTPGGGGSRPRCTFNEEGKKDQKDQSEIPSRRRAAFATLSEVFSVIASEASS